MSICHICKRRHVGECCKNNTKCFTYSEQGHLKRDSSKAKEKKAVPANINVVNVEDEASNNLVEGIISIQRILSISLFESICTHSFISYRMVRKLNLKPRMVEPSFIVSTPNGDKTVVDKYISSIIINL